MGIAARGQDTWVLHDISAGSGLDVLAAQRAKQRLNLVIGLKLFSNVESIKSFVSLAAAS